MLLLYVHYSFTKADLNIRMLGNQVNIYSYLLLSFTFLCIISIKKH